MMKYNISYKNCREMLIDFFFNVHKWRYLIHVSFALRFRGNLESSTGASIIYEQLHN